MSTSTAVAKPSIFGGMSGLALPNTGIEKLDVRESTTPYVGFLSTKSQRFGEVRDAIPGASDGTVYYAGPTGEYKKISNFKFHLLAADRLWVQRDDANKPIKATRENPGDYSSPLKDNVETIIAVYLDDGSLVPALCTFNTAKSKAGLAAIKGLQDSQTPAWGEKSADHKETLKIPLPNFRSVTHVQTSVKSAKNGRKMIAASGVAKPTTLGEAKQAVEGMSQESFTKQFEQVKRAFASRLAELNALVTA